MSSVRRARKREVCRLLWMHTPVAAVSIRTLHCVAAARTGLSTTGRCLTGF